MNEATDLSPFQRRIYDLLRTVPRGRVVTYGDLARAAGCASARAVGQALRRNPFAPAVPCHRVLPADLSLGGFNGCRRGAEPARKRALLAREGVRFGPATGRLAEPARRWPLPPRREKQHG
jgi:methylated-DNA-[protein]-cysteine S-methyltransferase